MSARIFDGKEKARQLEADLESRVAKLKEQGIRPKLVSITVGRNKVAKKYLSIKKSAAQAVGADLQIRDLPKDIRTQEIMDLIQDLNTKENVHGIMLQLPLPKEFDEDAREQVISTIINEKDVDGMKKESKFVAPVVRAVLMALKDAQRFAPEGRKAFIAVVGAQGFVGSKIYSVLEEMGYEVAGYDKETKALGQKTKEADVLISAVGKHGLIKKNMVKLGAVVIDVGAPKPDVEDKVKETASFITPVPGGVGPLTVACLMENLIEAAATVIEKSR